MEVRTLSAGAENAVALADILEFNGWVAGSDARASLCAVVDGRVLTAAVVYRQMPRPDVARLRGRDSLLAGFSMRLPASALGAGRHTVTVGVKNGDGVDLMQSTAFSVR